MLPLGDSGTGYAPFSEVLSKPLTVKSTYPPELLVLQCQDTCALCEQLDLHSRQGMGRGEVTLGAPPAERIREVSVDMFALTTVNSSLPPWAEQMQS